MPDLASPAANPEPAETIGEKLTRIINTLPPDGVTLLQIRDLVGHDGLLLLTIFLTIVFLIPVSIPGVSTVFGAAILMIGISRLLRRNLWLPAFVAHRVLPSAKLQTALSKGCKWVQRLERISRPHRLKWLAAAGIMDSISSAALILGALLLMAPLGFVPFSNTLPALALLFLAIGLLQRDGLCLLLGHLFNLATMIYFAILGIGGSSVIREAIDRFF